MQSAGALVSSQSSIAPRLAVRNVAKTFGHGEAAVAALDDVSMSISAGQFVSIIGPSGCGKSTLFSIIAGLEVPDGGTVEVDGNVTAGRSDWCAYMPQNDLLFPWRTILDNTILGLEVQGIRRRVAREKARGLFSAFGIAGREHAYPFELSGGMRQRAALLRTVVQDRSVLLLDEPFGALDSLTRTDMQQWLANVWEQFSWTVVLVTHDIREAVLLSDVVYVMTSRPGRISEEIVNTLPRPRTLEMITDPAFVRMEAELLHALHRGTAGGPAGRMG